MSLLALVGLIAGGLVAKQVFSQAYDFAKGESSPANTQWPSMNFISPSYGGYVDAHYPDVNTAPFAGAGNIGRDEALTQTLPYTPWMGYESQVLDHMGQNFGGDDNGFYYSSNPYQGWREPPLANFNNVSL